MSIFDNWFGSRPGPPLQEVSTETLMALGSVRDALANAGELCSQAMGELSRVTDTPDLEEPVRATAKQLEKALVMAMVAADEAAPKLFGTPPRRVTQELVEYGRSAASRLAEASRAALAFTSDLLEHSPELQYQRGVDFASGRGGWPEDDVQAVAWFEKAAKQNHPKGQDFLGAMYLLGRGVAQDFNVAFGWFTKSANQGYALAQRNLGTMYAEGKGVPPDPVTACMWLDLAARGGALDAGRLLSEVRANLSASDVEEAKRRADSWQPSHL
ncbi:MAG: sel1 repeat family protein [Chromatiales bacterium]|nr:sel1 repeat family protein [Chromatiales bacterium]